MCPNMQATITDESMAQAIFGDCPHAPTWLAGLTSPDANIVYLTEEALVSEGTVRAFTFNDGTLSLQVWHHALNHIQPTSLHDKLALRP
jgi:hypothetical protein